MDIEVSLKIRSAIKAKLVELGCHVDEELPDYIMVLIANRRTRTHMEEDLNLFLGDNTSAFTTWLHHVLKKLEQITTTATGKAPGLFADDVSASVAAVAVDLPNANPTPQAVEVPPATVNVIEESSGSTSTKKKSSKKELVEKNDRQKTEDDASPKSRIKLNRINLNLSPRSSKSLKDSRSKLSTSESEHVISEDKNKSKSKSNPPEYISLSSPAPRMSFKIPGPNFKKTSGSKRKAEDEDFTDCLNLKAEADEEDLFLEPIAPPVKSKAAKIARKPILAPGDDGGDLELLRQKVIDSTRRKGPIATRLKQQAEAERLGESEKHSEDAESASDQAEKHISPTQDKEESGRHGDRKKISSRNIESLNKLLKSNVEVKRERNDTKERSRSPRSSRPNDSENRRRSRRDSPERDQRDARHRLTNKRKLESEMERHQPASKMRSTIGMVSMNRTTSRHHFEKEEEYDPSCPEVSMNANKLQSIIKVPERIHSSKSAGLQEPLSNKKLLFRAMADAEKSLLQTRQITSKFEEKERERRSRQQDRRRSSSPVPRNLQKARRSPPISRNLEKGRKSIHERLGYMGRKSVSPAEVQDLELEPGHTIEEWEYMDDDDDDLELSQYRHFGGDEEVGIIINIPNESNVGRNVMLETKDNSSDMMLNQRHHLGQMTQPRSISIQVHSDDDDDDDDSSSTEDDDENNNNASDRDRSGNNTVNEDSVPSNPDQDPNQSADYEIVLNESNTNLPSPSDQNEMENSNLSDGGSRSDFKKVVARGSDSRIQITLNNDGPQLSSLGQQQPIKTFQPAFSPMPLQQSQPPIQQQQICKFWPNCTFSDKCMYSHPPCKFNTKCTKPNCPYKHIGFTKNTVPFHLQSLNPGGHPLSSVRKPPPSTNGVKVCKYFPKCHTMSCPFFHPTPCRFGTGCTDLKCKNYHPGVTVAKKKFGGGPPVKIPAGQFRWTAPTMNPATGSGLAQEAEVKTAIE